MLYLIIFLQTVWKVVFYYVAENVFLQTAFNIAKKESRLKFYRMSFDSHSIFVIFFNALIFSNISVKYESKWKQKVI